MLNATVAQARSSPSPAGYVEVVDTLPAGLEFVSAADNGTYDPASRSVVWRLGALPQGGQHRLAGS